MVVVVVVAGALVGGEGSWTLDVDSGGDVIEEEAVVGSIAWPPSVLLVQAAARGPSAKMAQATRRRAALWEDA